MKIVFTMLLLTFTPMLTLSQGTTTKQALSNYFLNFRKGNNPAPPSLDLSVNAEATLNFLAEYLTDSLVSVRLKSVDLVKDIGLKSTKPLVRKTAVRLLVIQWGSNSELNRRAFGSLKKFNASDFDRSSRDSLVRRLEGKYPNRESLLRLIGFVGKEENVISIKPFASAANGVSICWNALLAMARLGDAESIDLILQKTKKLNVNDASVNQLFPDLVYTRRKELFDFLVEVIHSEQANCESADNDNPTSILCGYRVMEQLAPAIRNYPLSLDASGDVKTWNYQQSLEKVRQWFRQNSNYQIITDTF